MFGMEQMETIDRCEHPGPGRIRHRPLHRHQQHDARAGGNPLNARETRIGADRSDIQGHLL